MKKQPSEWEKIITNETTDKGLISKIYNSMPEKKKKKTQSKSAKKTDISPKKTYRWLTIT